MHRYMVYVAKKVTVKFSCLRNSRVSATCQAYWVSLCSVFVTVCGAVLYCQCLCTVKALTGSNKLTSKKTGALKQHATITQPIENIANVHVHLVPYNSSQEEMGNPVVPSRHVV